MESKKLNINDIIAMRQKLDATIKDYWSIIKNENTVSKRYIKEYRLHELPVIHNKILQMIQQRVVIKGILNNINNSNLMFNTKDFIKSHYYDIYMLGETQEQITKLNEIRKKCINPKTKAQKGKKNIGKDEVFSYEKITSMIGKLEMDVNKYKTNIKKFNDSQSIEIIDNSIDSLLSA